MYARPSKLVLKESRCIRSDVSKLAQNTQQTSLGIEWRPIESRTRESDSAGRKIKTVVGIEEVDEVKGKSTGNIANVTSGQWNIYGERA